MRPDGTAHVSLYEYDVCNSNSLSFMFKLVNQLYGKTEIATITGEEQQLNMESILDGVSVDGRNDDEMAQLKLLAHEEDPELDVRDENCEEYDSDEGANVVEDEHACHFSGEEEAAKKFLELQTGPDRDKLHSDAHPRETVIKQQQQQHNKDNVFDGTDDAPEAVLSSVQISDVQ